MSYPGTVRGVLFNAYQVMKTLCEEVMGLVVYKSECLIVVVWERNEICGLVVPSCGKVGI